MIEASLQGNVHTRYVIEFPVRDADGKVSGLGAIAVDVTERKHAEARGIFGLCQDGGKRGR